MPETPNSSFIPRQSPVRQARHAEFRQIHLLSVFSYGVFAIALALTTGAYFYQRHVEAQLEIKVEELDQAINGFNQADMNQVREFNTRLVQARERLENGISLTSIFGALEEATLKSVTFDSLKLERDSDAGVALEVKMSTDTFDSSLFQRGVLERSSVVESVLVDSLTLKDGDESTPSGVSFLAKIVIPTKAVPNQSKSLSVPVPESTSATGTASSSSEELTKTAPVEAQDNSEDLSENNQPSI
jgi:hypothetical protein